MIRIREHMDVVVLDTCKIQSVEQSKCVLHVHIVISDAVHDQKADVLRQGRDIGDGRVVVSFSVVLWCVHVTLRVDGIVVSPISHRSNSHSVLECLSPVLLKRLQCVESSVTPAPDRKSVSIDVLLASPNLGCSDLIVCLVVTNVASRDASELATKKACTSSVHCHNNVAETSGNVRLEIDLELLIDFL